MVSRRYGLFDLPNAGDPLDEGRGVCVPGVVRMARELLDGISVGLDRESAEAVTAEFAAPVRETVRRIESACRRRGCEPVHLPTPSRRSYALLAFLNADGLLARYVESTAAAKRQIVHLAKSPEPPPCRVRLDDLIGIYRYRFRPGEWSFRLNPGFLAADREIMALVVGDALFARRPDRRRRLHEFTHDERFLSIVQDIEDMAVGLPRTEGSAYDLEEVCEAVRHGYFDRPAPRPAFLTWSERRTYITFGHYNSLRDRITISRSLDDRRVPRYVIEYIMYHELLHKLHGIGWATVRRAMHTRAFRGDERMYPQIEAARVFLRKWSAHMRRRLAA